MLAPAGVLAADPTVRPSIRTRRLLFFLLFLHLLWCVLGALDIAPFTRWDDVYVTYSGASTAFKFFAPNVGSEPRALFIMQTIDGKKFTRTLGSGRGRENSLRLNGIVHTFTELEPEEDKDFKIRRAMAASLASMMMAKYPQAVHVLVKIQSYHLPSMAQWREGGRPMWEDIYVANFNH